MAKTSTQAVTRLVLDWNLKLKSQNHCDIFFWGCCDSADKDTFGKYAKVKISELSGDTRDVHFLSIDVLD